MGLILLIILILLLVGAFPRWGYNKNWGYGPSGGLGMILLIVISSFSSGTFPTDFNGNGMPELDFQLMAQC